VSSGYAVQSLQVP